MALPAGQHVALANLARKAAGEAVDWINIADACALTDQGLAMRDRQGWHITPQGVAALEAEPKPPATGDATDNLHALIQPPRTPPTA